VTARRPYFTPHLFYAFFAFANIHHFFIHAVSFSVLRHLAGRVLLMLSLTCSIMYYGNIIFDLRIFNLRLFFSGTLLGRKTGTW
jgi:hypothetical protein